MGMLSTFTKVLEYLAEKNESHMSHLMFCEVIGKKNPITSVHRLMSLAQTVTTVSHSMSLFPHFGIFLTFVFVLYVSPQTHSAPG